MQYVNLLNGMKSFQDKMVLTKPEIKKFFFIFQIGAGTPPDGNHMKILQLAR